MAQHAGREDLRHPKLFHGLLERAAAEKKPVAEEHKLLGYPTCTAAVANLPTTDTLASLDRPSAVSDSATSEDESVQSQ